MKQLTMTKVLTPLAALAFAFGVQAATVGLLSSDGFESYTADTAMVTNQNGWVFSYGSDGADDASTIAAYGAAAKPASLPDAFAAAGDNYLKLSTEDGTLFRNMDGSSGDTVSLTGGLYVDTDVQFTVTDSADRPEVTGEDKFIVWLEADTTANTTNLCAWARHYYATGSNSNAVFKLIYENGSEPDIQPGAWHRLTVKAIENVNQGEATTIPAFQVYLDGLLLKTTEFAVNANEYTLTTAAAALANAGTILPAMANTMQSLSKVGFSGEGALDNVAVTRAVPAFSANSAQVAFNFAGSTVTGVGISALNLSVDNSGDCVSVETGTSFQIQLTGYNPNTHNITITPSGNILFDESTMTVTVLGSGAASLVFTTIAKDTVTVTVNFADLVDSGKMGEDCTGVWYSYGNESPVEIDISRGTSKGIGSFKLGTNITFTVTYAQGTDWGTKVTGSSNLSVNDNVVHIDSFGAGTATVTLTAFAPAAKIGETSYESIQAAVDSVTTSAQTTIKLSGNADLETPVSVAAGQDIVIDLNGKTITGADDEAVFTNAGTLTITDTNDGTKGSVVAGTNGYVVSDTGTLNLVYGTYEGAFNGMIDSLTADCLFDNNLSGVYTPATGYEMAEVEGNMYQLKAQSYSITYMYGENTLDLTPASYTYNVATALPASADEVTGKTFAGWYDNSGLTGDPVTTIVAGTTGAQTFYAKYTDNTYTIKFVYGLNGETTNTQSVAYNTMPTAPTSEADVAGYTWNWDVTPVNAVADATYTAVYTPIEYTVLFISGEGATTTQTIVKTYGQTIAAVDVNTAASVSGKNFTGWDPDPSFPITVTANATYTAQYEAAGGSDWSDTPAEIPAETSAATQYPALKDSALATADAKELTVWAKAKNISFSAIAEDTTGTYVEAFLLNCATSEVAEEKAAFKLDITVGANGTIEVNLPKEYNGTLQMKGKAALTDADWTPVPNNTPTSTYKFYKYELSLE